MKNVYEASTALDAYMILNLLEQEGISGRVDGEYLPGGVGELQAINLVRVMVNETDFEQARQVIREWEAIQVDREERPPRSRSSQASGFVFGLVIGGGLVLWAYNTPVTKDGIDMNGDGVLDEVRFYRNNRLIRTEVDRNLDGEVDAVYYYDRREIPDRAKTDDNFDGIFETNLAYENGLTRSQDSDLNQDGHVDYRATYKYGNLEEVLILGEGQDSRKKRQTFRMGKLVTSDYDSDGDDNFDISYDYDYFEEISRKSSMRGGPAQ